MSEPAVRNIKKDILVAAVTILALGAGVAVAGVVADRVLHRNEEPPVPGKTQVSTEDGTKESESETARKAVLDEEEDYVHKENLRTYLFLGVDVDGPVKKNEGYIDAGQADTQLVLVLDDENKTRTLLQLNRDSLVEIPVLGVMGDVVGYEKKQLALAHAYGDGLEKSCENNVNTVSKLLGDEKIDGYFALNMDGIGVLTDTIGGVEVTLESDYSSVDPEMVKGATLNLKGDQALRYLRSRKDVDDGTNLARMTRQRVFLNALEKKLKTVDSKTVLKAYDQVTDYRVTNMGSGTFVNVLEKMQQYENLGTKTIEGENSVDNDGYICYNLDEESLKKVIIDLFYQKAE
ncbi:MAG: LCP family protein [Lachnospiraceae bacterium]|nr:LCP family protein [Lachnospiraceae bacterium]